MTDMQGRNQHSHEVDADAAITCEGKTCGLANVLDYLTVACKAALRDEATPSLLPTPGHPEQFMRPAA
jgi:hypothetical protein